MKYVHDTNSGKNHYHQFIKHARIPNICQLSQTNCRHARQCPILADTNSQSNFRCTLIYIMLYKYMYIVVYTTTNTLDHALCMLWDIYENLTFEIFCDVKTMCKP